VKNQSNDLPIASLRMEDFFSLRAYSHYANDQYENGYPNIRAIANRFMVLRPVPLDLETGEPMKDTPNVISVLSRPNQDMSGVDFRDALAVLSMVHDKVYVLVWQIIGKEVVPATESVTEETVGGFTFLQDVQEEIFNGKIQYRVNVQTETGTAPRIFYPYQVMCLYDINPKNLLKGYSPSRAAHRWTRIDDYIADYEAGFFENGAVPAGQFMITAPTTKEYEDIVAGLKAKHQGAGKNNNVVYTYQPIDAEGKPAQATITWVPFNTTNKDLALKDLFEQANKKIESVYSVPALIKGDGEAPNYSTAQIIERVFVENTIRPFAIKKWTRFQHELNRITGGLGYAISFKLLTPNISAEDKAEAEANNIRVSTLTNLISRGFTIESSIAALGLPDSFKLLKQGTQPAANTDDNNGDEGEDVDESPGGTPSNRGSEGKRPKVSNQLTQEDIANYELQLREPARALMQSQVDRAIDTLDPQDVDTAATEEDKDTFVDDMMIIISAILLYAGVVQWEEGRQLLREAGIEPPLAAYELTDAAVTRYRTYLGTIADSYSSDTSSSIRAVLSRANEENWTRGEIETGIRNIMNTDEWRVTRLSTSEINRSSGMASVEAMIKIEDESEATLEKSMMTTGPNPCEFCLSRVDAWYPVRDIMVPKGETVIGTDGGMFVNNWDNNEGHDLHANGLCVPIYRVSVE
jgi:hypothetical protein